MQSADQDTVEKGPGRDIARRHRVTALCLAAMVTGMVGMSYAAVPLYRIFCQVTGYGGTTQRALSSPEKALDQTVEIRFDANIASELPWKFRPVERKVEVKIGESVLVFYRAKNLADTRIRGTASFNVTPSVAGSYFSKIDCFCFTDQVLAPGEEIDMALTFFVDPEIVNDPEARNIKEITLSYTFFRVMDGPPPRGEKQIRQKTRRAKSDLAMRMSDVLN